MKTTATFKLLNLDSSLLDGAMCLWKDQINKSQNFELHLLEER